MGGGILPGGLTFSTAGKLSGTPTTTGGFTFVVRVDDSAGQAAGVSRSLNVVPPLAVAGLCTKICTVEAGCVICGTYGTSSGGAAPLQYKVTAGAPPTGMTISGLALAGPFPAPPPPPPPSLTTGPPPPPYEFAFTTTVTDALGGTASVTSYYSTFPHIAFTTTSATCSPTFFTSATGCTAQLQYTMGTPNGTPTIDLTSSATLPSGSTAVAQNGVVTLTVATPGCGTAPFDATVTLVLVDQSLCGPANCTSSPATVTVHMTDGC